MNVCLLFSLSILIISSNALQCQNGGVDLSGVCVCPSGYIGDKCQSIDCGVHGVSAFPDKCTCESGWVGKFCNITKWSVCQMGELTAQGECVCYRNWMGPRCTMIVCKGSNSEIVDWECKCRYSGTYPDCNNKFPTCRHGELSAHGECVCDRNWKGARCDTFYCEGSNAEAIDGECRCKHSGTHPDFNNKFPTTKVVFWSSVGVVGVILLAIGHCWCNCNLCQCGCDCQDDEEQQGVPPLYSPPVPPPTVNEPPPSYTEAVAK